jgi:hypothetical protein
MALTVLTAASTRHLTTIEAVEAQLGFEDHNLYAMIGRASAAIERYCHRIFAQQRYEEVVMSVPDQYLYLSVPSVVTVQSVLFDGATAIPDYRLEKAATGLLFRRDGWYHARDKDYTIQYVAGFILPGQVNPVVPTGEALPGDVEQAVIEAVKVWWHERNPAGPGRIASRQIADERVSYAVSASREGLPPMSQQILLDGGWSRWVIR